jgi:hypothetical protein
MKSVQMTAQRPSIAVIRYNELPTSTGDRRRDRYGMTLVFEEATQTLKQLRLANHFSISPLFGLGQPVPLPDTPRGPADAEISPNHGFANAPVLRQNLGSET